jgi:membrane protein required for colicin V production
VAFLFFAWLVPPRTQPAWVANAKSKVVLQSTGDWLMSMLPEDPENTILKRLKRPKPEEEPQDAQPEQRGSLGGGPREASYGQSDRSRMQRLIEGNIGHGTIAVR